MEAKKRIEKQKNQEKTNQEKTNPERTREDQIVVVNYTVQKEKCKKIFLLFYMFKYYNYN